MQSGGIIYDPEFLKHGTEEHREKPERARAIRQALADSPLEKQLRFIDPRPATDAEVERVHPPEYAAMLDKFCLAGGGWIDEDTYLSPDSARIARLAAGSAARAVEAVVSEGFPWVFSICRPPGHHATPNTSMGF